MRAPALNRGIRKPPPYVEIEHRAMEPAIFARIRKLCEQAVDESDGKRLMELAQEIIELYDRVTAKARGRQERMSPLMLKKNRRNDGD